MEVVEDAEDFSGIFPAFLSFDISIGFTDATASFIEDARFLVLDISGTSTDFLMDVEAGFTDVTGTSVTFMDFVTDSSLTGAEVADTEAVDTEVGFDIVAGFTVAEAGFIDTAGTSVIFLDFVTAVEMTNTEVAGTEVGFITAAVMADLEVCRRFNGLPRWGRNGLNTRLITGHLPQLSVQFLSRPRAVFK